MSDMKYQIDDIEIDFVRKNVKRLCITVSRVKGVIVTIPLQISFEEAVSFVKSKQQWLKKHYDKMRELPVETEKQYVDGEKVSLFGKTYIIKIEYVNSHLLNAKIEGDMLILKCNKQTTAEFRKKLIELVYKNRLNQYLHTKVSEYCVRFNENPIPRISVHKARTKWGSCNSEKRTLNFNLWLAQCPYHLIDYIIVHEISHLRYANHSSTFWHMVESRMPDYKERQKELNANYFPL